MSSTEPYPEVTVDELGIVPPQADRPPEWPKKIRTLTATELDRLTIDGAGRFYWDGSLVNYEPPELKVDQGRAARPHARSRLEPRTTTTTTSRARPIEGAELDRPDDARAHAVAHRDDHLHDLDDVRAVQHRVVHHSAMGGDFRGRRRPRRSHPRPDSHLDDALAVARRDPRRAVPAVRIAGRRGLRLCHRVRMGLPDRADPDPLPGDARRRGRRAPTFPRKARITQVVVDCALSTAAACANTRFDFLRRPGNMARDEFLPALFKARKRPDDTASDDGARRRFARSDSPPREAEDNVFELVPPEKIQQAYREAQPEPDPNAGKEGRNVHPPGRGRSEPAVDRQ